MKIWTSIKNFFKRPWMKSIIDFVGNKLKEVLGFIGKSVYNEIMSKIVEVNLEDISGEEKFKKVYTHAQDFVSDLPESTLNFLIETLVQDLKEKGKI